MKCRRCKDKGKTEKAIIFLPHHNLSLCKDCFLAWYEKRLDETIKKMDMITKKDKIMVAVSGGKDSLALWYALTRLGYEADGLYINLGIDERNYSSTSGEKAEILSKRLNRPLYVIDVKKQFGKGIPDLNKLTKQPACSICGLIKRYFINKVALENGYTCVATGHNLDDEVATLFSITLSWDIDSLIRQLPILPEKEGFVRKVKPLIGFTEKENLLYCLLQKIDYIREECPLSTGVKTIFYKNLLNQVEQKSPGTKLRFYFNFQKKLHPLLPGQIIPPLHSCSICGQPTTSYDICAFCRFKQRVKHSLQT